MTKTYVFGLTGGIGSGKSTVGKMFLEAGIPVIDADAIAKNLILSNKYIYEELISVFGPEILSTDVSSSTGYTPIDKKKLSTLAFKDKDSVSKLNKVMHPAIQQKKSSILKKWEEDLVPFGIYEAALLIETKSYLLLDGLIVIDIPNNLQLERAHSRGMDFQEIENRKNLQLPREMKLEVATWVIDNSKDLHHTRKQVTELIRKIQFFCKTVAKKPSPPLEDG